MSDTEMPTIEEPEEFFDCGPQMDHVDDLRTGSPATTPGLTSEGNTPYTRLDTPATPDGELLRQSFSESLNLNADNVAPLVLKPSEEIADAATRFRRGEITSNPVGPDSHTKQ